MDEGTDGNDVIDGTVTPTERGHDVDGVRFGVAGKVVLALRSLSLVESEGGDFEVQVGDVDLEGGLDDVEAVTVEVEEVRKHDVRYDAHACAKPPPPPPPRR